MITDRRLAQLGFSELVSTLEKQIGFISRFKSVDGAAEQIDFLAKFIPKDFPTLTVSDFSEIVSNGMVGKYGEVIKIEPQVFFKWIRKWQADQKRSVDYLKTPLLPINWPARSNEDWFKETNKCYDAFLRGLSHENFHHCVYDRLVIDGFISTGSYVTFYNRAFDYTETKDRVQNEVLFNKQYDEIARAKREVLKRFFAHLKAGGRTYVYFIKTENAA